MDTDRTQIDATAPPIIYPYRELTEEIIGAAMEVHRELGPGFLERVYEQALTYELALRGISAQAQTQIRVAYKGQPVGSYVSDLLVDSKVLCEIKASTALGPEYEAQLLNYLKATGIKVGLLLNFGTRRLQVKRRVF